MSQFLTPYRAELLEERREGRLLWRMLEPLVYESEVAACRITVPAGFIHDGESIGLRLRSFTGFECLRAGAVHDWLYTVRSIDIHQIERDLADLVYEEACQVDGTPGLDPVDARKKYNAVSFYGKSNWGIP